MSLFKYIIAGNRKPREICNILCSEGRPATAVNSSGCALKFVINAWKPFREPRLPYENAEFAKVAADSRVDALSNPGSRPGHLS